MSATSAECRIAVMGDPASDRALDELKKLPPQCFVLTSGLNIEHMDAAALATANVLLCVAGNGATLAPILNAMPNLVVFIRNTCSNDFMCLPSDEFCVRPGFTLRSPGSTISFARNCAMTLASS